MEMIKVKNKIPWNLKTQVFQITNSLKYNSTKASVIFTKRLRFKLNPVRLGDFSEIQYITQT